MRWLLTGLALAFAALFLIVPLVAVFSEALAKGWRAYVDAITEPDALTVIARRTESKESSIWASKRAA